MLNKDYQIVQSLGEVCKDLNSLAYTLLRIFRQDNNELNLIQTIAIKEMNQLGIESFFFLPKICIFYYLSFLNINAEMLKLCKVVNLSNDDNEPNFSLEKKETLFRGNTLTTKLMDQYMKMIAIPYLQQTIKSVILKIMESKQCCEVKKNLLLYMQNRIKFSDFMLSFPCVSVKSFASGERFKRCRESSTTY